MRETRSEDDKETRPKAIGELRTLQDGIIGVEKPSKFKGVLVEDSKVLVIKGIQMGEILPDTNRKHLPVVVNPVEAQLLDIAECQDYREGELFVTDFQIEAIAHRVTKEMRGEIIETEFEAVTREIEVIEPAVMKPGIKIEVGPFTQTISSLDQVF